MAKPQATDLTILPPIAEATGMSIDVWSTLNTSIFPGAKIESIIAAYRYCKARGLDILKRPVHIVPMNVENKMTNTKEYVDVIMPGIYELRTTASRTNLMAGTDAPVFGEKINVRVRSQDKRSDEEAAMLVAPESCAITVWRLDAKGVRQPYTHVEFFEEAVARTKEGAINSMWQKRPRGQLAKCAEAGALRKAFPEEIGGQFVAEEMAGQTIDTDAIPGEYTVVQPGDVPDPEPVAEEAAPFKVGAPVSAETPKEAPAKAEPRSPLVNKAPDANPNPSASGATKPIIENEPEVMAKIDLPDGASKLLNKKLLDNGLSIDALRKGFGKDITISTVNEAFTWIKEHSTKAAQE